MSQQYTTMSLDALKLLCATINKTVDLPNTVISDTSIATNTTYSSHRLDKEFDTLEDELKHYTDTAIAGLNKLTKEIINDKSLVVKDNVLYLYKAADDPSNDYMQMMLINGVAVELGSTQVDMSDYYNKTDSDNKFAAKLDLNTLTAVVNDKINKTDIVTSIGNDSTNEKVASAKAVYKELSKKVDAVSITVTTMDDFCALVDSESYSWLIPKLGFIAWDNPIAPDANNTYLVLSKQQAHAFTYIGNMYVLDYANKKWKSVSSTSNPNLLDNPWFTVNQRGATTYSGSSVYTVDRWICVRDGITIEVSSDGLKVPKQGYFRQPVGTEFMSRLIGKQVTMSLIVDNVLYSKTFVISTDKQYQNFVFDNGCQVAYSATTGVPYFDFSNELNDNIVTIRAVKLELGSVSTLHLDSTPNYQQELAKCQRYYQRIKVNANAIVGQGCVRNVNTSTKKAQYRIFIPISQPMRKTPTLGYKDLKICDFTTEGDVIIDNTLTGLERLKIKDMGIQSYTDNQIQVRVTTSNVDTGDTELARGNIGVMLADGLWTSSYIEFSADL